MRVLFFLTLFLFVSVMLFAGTVVEEIVARVGNEIISKSDYEEQLRLLHDDLSRRYEGEELEQQFSEQKKGLLEYLINQKLLEQKAKELNLDVEDDVAAAVKRLREENNIPDDAALEEALRKEGSSLAQLRENFRKRVIQQKVLWNYVQGKVNITEEEIKNYYQQHKNEIVAEPVTKVRRYAISDAKETKENLLAEAQTVLRDLRAGKELKSGDTPHLTVDESAEFAKSEVNPQLLEVLDATPVNSFTDLIEGPTGYLILRVEARKEATQISYEDARDKIYNLLLQERAEKYQKSFLDDLRKQNYIVINHNYS